MHKIFIQSGQAGKSYLDNSTPSHILVTFTFSSVLCEFLNSICKVFLYSSYVFYALTSAHDENFIHCVIILCTKLCRVVHPLIYKYLWLIFITFFSFFLVQAFSFNIIIIAMYFRVDNFSTILLKAITSRCFYQSSFNGFT